MERRNRLRVRQAVERSKAAFDDKAQIQGLRDCYASLSRREREVLILSGGYCCYGPTCISLGAMTNLLDSPAALAACVTG
jgi:hypothetical protein